MTVYFVYFMKSEEKAPQKVFQAGNTERQLQIKKLGSRINSNW